MNWTLYYYVIFFFLFLIIVVLKLVLSEIRIAIPGFSCFPFLGRLLSTSLLLAYVCHCLWDGSLEDGLFNSPLTQWTLRPILSAQLPHAGFPASSHFSPESVPFPCPPSMSSLWRAAQSVLYVLFSQWETFFLAASSHPSWLSPPYSFLKFFFHVRDINSWSASFVNILFLIVVCFNFVCCNYCKKFHIYL